MKKILAWFSGKKSVILGVVMTVLSYLGSVGEISPDLAVLIGGLLTVIFGSASYATGKIVYGK